VIVTLPRAAGLLVKGSWMPRRLSLAPGKPRRMVVVVSCHRCGTEAHINREDPECGHVINSLGHVAPALQCEGCGAETVVRLEGYGRGPGEECG
jgi:RNase P subunit RPR2